MNRMDSKLTLQKETVRVLESGDLTGIGAAMGDTFYSCDVRCPSVDIPCTTYLSCGGGCDTA